jgi:hypothetical protein
MLVYNVKNTSNDKPDSKYESWLDFWEKKTRRTASKCLNIYCNSSKKDNLVGAHVKEKEKTTIYITILCKDCNNHYNDETAKNVKSEDLVMVQ